MRTQERDAEDKAQLRAGIGVFSVGVLAMLVVCCGGQALAFGALGGLAFGSAFGVSAGVLAAVLVGVGVVVLRRRHAATCPSSQERSRSHEA